MMKSPYRKYKIGETVKVSEREYNSGDDPARKAIRNVNTYKVIGGYPLFVVCERKSKFGNAKIRTSFLKWDLEHGTV